jgi:hypothetical protein
MKSLPRAKNSIQIARSVLFLLVVMGAGGCTTQKVRIDVVPLRGVSAPQTVLVFASSSIGGRPMGDDSSLRDHVVTAFQKRFPGARFVESDPDMVVYFTIVDYVPGCAPDCKKFRTYRNWRCEVVTYARESHPDDDTMTFNLEGSTYNPFYNPALNCASQFSKASRGSK